jgi:hypothetical protein
MPRIIGLLVLAAACIQSQDLLLPQAQHIAGVVVDSEGKAVAEAQIDHAMDGEHARQTDLNGKFELDTRAPVFVIRKAGFRSELLRTGHTPNLRVVLQRLKDQRPFPLCSTSGSYYGIDNWGASFRFPKFPDVKAGKPSGNVDYITRSYYVKTKLGQKEISHRSGILSGFGIPPDEEVWGAIKYEEAAYDLGRGLMIVDARGQSPVGQRWRYLGKFGESASYSGLEEATAKVLDRLLDGACLAHP